MVSAFLFTADVRVGDTRGRFDGFAADIVELFMDFYGFLISFETHLLNCLSPMEKTLKHRTPSQFSRLPLTSPGNNRPNRPQASQALTIKPDHSGAFIERYGRPLDSQQGIGSHGFLEFKEKVNAYERRRLCCIF